MPSQDTNFPPQCCVGESKDEPMMSPSSSLLSWSLRMLLLATWLQLTTASSHCPSPVGRVITKDQRPTSQDGDKDDSGRTFYLTFLENNGENPPSYYTIFITTKETTAVVFTVEAPGIGFSTEGETTFGVVANVTIPSNLTASSTQSTYQRGVTVRSANGGSLLVYCLNEERFSTDAFLALPYVSNASTSLGQVDGLFTYVFAAYDYSQNVGPSLAAVVAHEDGTNITVFPRSSDFGRVEYGSTVSLFYTGVETSLTLKRGETIYMRTNDDMTGSVVTSTSPITLLSGMKCTQVPQGLQRCDHIVEQIPPVSTWGSRFVTVPLQQRESYDVFRFIAGHNCISVTVSCVNGISGEVSPPIEFQLNKTEFHEMNISSLHYCLVSSNNGILVVQYSIGTEADGISADPFMAIVPPIDRASHQYTFITPKSSVQVYNHFINLVIPAIFYQPSEITIDGKPLLMLTNDIVSIAVNGPIAYYAARVELADGSHTLSHSNVLAQMVLLVYGYGIKNSYGYPGAYAIHALDIDPFNFFAVKTTARCLHLLWERPIGASGVVKYAVTVEDADNNRREVSTETTNLEVCGLKELTDYTISLNATSNMTVTDTAVVAHASTAALLIKLSVLNISSANATALCTFSSGLEIDTFRCLVVCAPSPGSSGSQGQRSSVSDSLQADTTETVASLTELAANTQYTCDAVAVSSGIWSLEQHQVTAVFRTLEQSGHIPSGGSNELDTCAVTLGLPLGLLLALLLVAVILLFILLVALSAYRAKRKAKASVSPLVTSYKAHASPRQDCKPPPKASADEQLHIHADNMSSSKLPLVSD